jgi:hypothetical protein
MPHPKTVSSDELVDLPAHSGLPSESIEDDARDDESADENEIPIRETNEATEAPEEFEIDDEDLPEDELEEDELDDDEDDDEEDEDLDDEEIGQDRAAGWGAGQPCMILGDANHPTIIVQGGSLEERRRDHP